MRDPALDAADPGAVAAGVAGHDVGPAAEVVTGPVDDDGPDAFVLLRRGDGGEQPGHHLVVDRVALLGPVQTEAEDPTTGADLEAGTALVRPRVGHGMQTTVH